jgi:murein DD-endopeptidase MepM/ murein hydrolase activator NlpD
MQSWTRRKFLWATPGLFALGPALPSLRGDTLHKVRRGDTLSEIAQSYGVTVGDIKRANQLKGDLIRVDQQLIIPQGSADLDRFKKEFSKYRIDRKKWKYIVTHHSAIKNGNATIYDRNHRRRGMQNGLAYHFVIGNGVDSGDGEIEIGSRWKNQLDGGHVRKHYVNQHGIGICLIGNFMETRPTPKQIRSFTALVDLIGNYHLGGSFQYTAHKEVDKNHTVCPGKYFPLREMHRRFG